jgi:hypothetical protein
MTVMAAKATMNEGPVLGDAKDGPNVQVWVLARRKLPVANARLSIQGCQLRGIGLLLR